MCRNSTHRFFIRMPASMPEHFDKKAAVLLSSCRTRNSKHIFAGPVHKLCLLRIRHPVIHFPAFPPADNQPALTQKLQMMGNCRIAHLHNCRNIADTFLSMAQKPENSQPAAVTDLLKHLRCLNALLLSRQLCQHPVNIISMIMGQILCHRIFFSLPSLPVHSVVPSPSAPVFSM